MGLQEYVYYVTRIASRALELSFLNAWVVKLRDLFNLISKLLILHVTLIAQKVIIKFLSTIHVHSVIYHVVHARIARVLVSLVIQAMSTLTKLA